MRMPRHVEHSLLPEECLVYVGANSLRLEEWARRRVDETLDLLDEGGFEDLVQRRDDTVLIGRVGSAMPANGFRGEPLTIGGMGFLGSDIHPEEIRDLDAVRRLLCTIRHMLDRETIRQWPQSTLDWYLRRRSLLGHLAENQFLGETLRTPWRPGARISRAINGRTDVHEGPFVTDEEAGSHDRPMIMTMRIQDVLASGCQIVVNSASMYRFLDIDPLTAMRAIASVREAA
jgi:hypothetical protein